jgi:quercetin dioxygenase-like cupin family protein
MNMPSIIVGAACDVRRAGRPPGPTPCTRRRRSTGTSRSSRRFRLGIFGATVHTPQLTATIYRYGAGTSWEAHSHPQDQVTYVIEGAIVFVVDGRPVRLTAGQLATLPGGVFTSRERPPDP